MVRKWVRMFNEGRENVHDEERSGRPSLVNDDLVRKVNERVCDADVSQFLICPCTFLRFQGLYSMTFSVVANIAGGRILWGGCTKTYARYDKWLKMAANMWKNSLKNVESDKNKILYEILLFFFYNETVLTFWISLVQVAKECCSHSPAMIVGFSDKFKISALKFQAHFPPLCIRKAYNWRCFFHCPLCSAILGKVSICKSAEETPRHP